MSDVASNTPFPQLKTTGDGKHDVEVYIEDLIDYCIMQLVRSVQGNRSSEVGETTEGDGMSSSIVISCSQSSLQIQFRIIGTGSEQNAHGYSRSERVLRR